MIRVLIVDDEVASIKIIKKFLSMIELQLELIGTSENGIDAIQYLNSPFPPDLVITDMNMPAMDGISLLQYLIDFHPQIKIIVISGYFDFPYTHAAIKANVQDYILKPIMRDKFIPAVQKCCELIEKEKKMSVDQTIQEISVDRKLYQQILQQSSELKELLEQGNSKEISRLLSDMQSTLDRENASQDMYPLVYKTLSDTLLLYCADHEHSASEVPSYTSILHDSWNDIFFVINSLCIEYCSRIQEQRRLASINEVLEQVNNYIHIHYRENITLESVSMLFFIHKEYLSTLFRKKYGKTLGQYIIQIKIEDAKRQLEYTNRKVDDIAISLGYQDSAYFSRQFKKNTGMSPGKYRSLYTKNE